MRVLILGGTGEAIALAAMLHGGGHTVTTSLAGRTREPRPALGATRVGGFGGAEGLAAYLMGKQVDVLIDATHPFAATISRNALEAARRVGVRRVALYRPPWPRNAEDKWWSVPDVAAAAAILPAGARALLAIGRQHLAPFAARNDVEFVVRAIEPFEPPVPATVLLGRPSADPDEERALLERHAITHLVSRNSGGGGAAAKIVAARRAGLPVVMIDRPPPPPPPTAGSVEAVLRAVARYSGAEGSGT